MAGKPPTPTKTASGRSLVVEVPIRRVVDVHAGHPGLDQVIQHAIGYMTERSSMGPNTVLAIAVIAFSVCTAVITGMPVLGAAMLVGSAAALLALLLLASWIRARNEPVRAAEERRIAGNDARSRAPGRFEAMVPDTHPDWLPLFRAIHAMIKDEAAFDIADDMAFRLRDLHAAFDQAVADAGRSDITVIKAKAIEATVAIVETARKRHQDVEAAIRRADDARAPKVMRDFEEVARSISGLESTPTALPPPSASAALQRLIGLAEDALHVDPDLTDTNGARIDTLIREHLPRLLETHADAARSSASDLAAVDAQLAIGVEKVRASVERALSADAQARFDRLRTEVAFLTMRGEG